MSSFKFTLRNVCVEKTDAKFNIALASNIATDGSVIPKNTTKISDLMSTKNSEPISFMDETKCLRKCNLSMIDFSSNCNVKDLKYNCFWCRNPFDSTPVGCPIKFVPNTVVKTYVSEINKDTYMIRENTLKDVSRFPSDEGGCGTLSFTPNAIYITDGVFCSLPCAMAFAIDNKHNSLYDKSSMLLNRIYNDIMADRGGSIVRAKCAPAPHWRLLVEYGGDMTIKQFRDSFGKAEYDYHGILSQMQAIASLFERKLKF